MRDSKNSVFIFLECHVLIKSSQSTDAYGTILLLVEQYFYLWSDAYTYGTMMIMSSQSHRYHFCMHVCMCLCMSLRVHICMYVCMHACMQTCMYVCMHACMHAIVCVRVCVCLYVCMYVCMHLFMYTCTYPCMHACMHVYKHTYVSFLWRAPTRACKQFIRHILHY